MYPSELRLASWEIRNRMAGLGLVKDSMRREGEIICKSAGEKFWGGVARGGDQGSEGAGGAEAEHFAGASGTDGAGGGVRSGVRPGSLGAVAGGSGDGAGGAGGLEKAVYGEKDRDVGTGYVGARKSKRRSGGPRAVWQG